MKRTKHLLIQVMALLSIALGNFPLEVSAQEVFIGKAAPFGRSGGNFEVVGKVGSMTWIYRTTNSDYFLDAYNDSMRLMATVAMDFFPKETHRARFVNYSDRIVVFYTAEERNRLLLYGATLDDKGLLQGTPKLLHEEKTGWGTNKDNIYKTAFSEDRSQLAILVQSSSRNTREFQLLTFSNNLERLNARKINVPKEETGSMVKLDYAQISNNGKLMVPTFNTTSRGSIEDASLLIFDISSDDYRNIALMNSKEYYSDLIFKIDNTNQKIHVAALYKTGNSGNVEGTTLLQIDLQNGALTNQLKNKFPERFLKSFQEKNWKRAFNNAHLLQLIVKQDGGLILITEEQVFSIQNHYSGGYMGYYNYYNSPLSMGSTREYTFGDIAVMNYDVDGTLLWSEYIRKKQYSQEDDGVFSSFAFMNTGGSLLMMYNNFGSKDKSVTVAAIDISGQLQMTRINQFVLNNDWYMRGAQQIANRAIIVPTIGRNELNFVKVVF